MSAYRYLLHRIWAAPAVPERVVWVMLNPSTADDSQDDPTIRRCRGFSARAGAAGLTVLNLYAQRAVRPAELWAHPDPVGPKNDGIIAEVLTAAADRGWPVICAWGTKAGPERAQAVTAAIRAARIVPLALGVTRDGHPPHPLYLPGSASPRPYEPQLLNRGVGGAVHHGRPDRVQPALRHA